MESLKESVLDISSVIPGEIFEGISGGPMEEIPINAEIKPNLWSFYKEKAMEPFQEVL